MKSALFGKFTEVVSRVYSQGHRYRRTFAWLIADSIRATPRLWLRMLLATVLSLVANAAVIGAIYGYAKLVDGNVPFSILGTTIVPRESFLLLGAAVAGLLAVSFVLALSQYVARLSVIRAMGGFEKRCTLRVIGLYQLLPDPRAWRANEILQSKRILQLAKSDVAQSGMAVRFIGYGVDSLLTFLAALGVMFFSDPMTTAVVCGLGLIVVATQYPSNLFAAESTAIIIGTQADVQRELMALVTRAYSKPRHTDAEDFYGELSQFFDKPVPTLHVRAAENRLRAIELSGLTMRFGSALILGGVIMAFGITAIQDKIDWVQLLAYLMLLRISLASVTSVFQTVTSVTRLYPMIQELAEFLASASLAEEPLERNQDRHASDTLTIRAKRVDGDWGDLTLHRGTCCALLVPTRYGREIAAVFQRALGFRAEDRETQLFTVDLAIEAPRSGACKSVADWRNKLTTGLERLSENGTDVILIERRALAAMEPGDWACWRHRLRDRLLVVIYTDRSQSVADLDEKTLFLSGASEVELRWISVPTGGFSQQDLRRLRESKPADTQTAPEEEDMDS